MEWTVKRPTKEVKALSSDTSFCRSVEVCSACYEPSYFTVEGGLAFEVGLIQCQRCGRRGLGTYPVALPAPLVDGPSSSAQSLALR